MNQSNPPLSLSPPSQEQREAVPPQPAGDPGGGPGPGAGRGGRGRAGLRDGQLPPQPRPVPGVRGQRRLRGRREHPQAVRRHGVNEWSSDNRCGGCGWLYMKTWVTHVAV